MRPFAVALLSLLALVVHAWGDAGAQDYARSLGALVSPKDLSRFHELLASEPHVAGTPGDARQIERIRAAFAGMGLEVEVHRFRSLLSRPVRAALEIVGAQEPAQAPRGVLAIPIDERNLLADPSTAHPDLTYGWNAFSGSGDVTAPVVYANYGLRQDYDELRKLGIDVRGKIVLVRYGRCFRGYKARFAQEQGAAGVILYTDPADSGFTKGQVWPEGGGWANDACIQRGTLNTLPYPGDPGTPGVFASDAATRLDASTLDLPRIPVQPIGYGAAGMILARFQGPDAPEAWRGGLTMPYRLEGGDALRVRLMVEQERFVGESANIIATLQGSSDSSEFVMLGCHHDAWGFGSADPAAGTMCLLEAARCAAEAARVGMRPARTMRFAAWGAEEFGIIGSTEWCEANEATLSRDALLYVNLDMAAMGPNPALSISPELDAVARAAAGIALASTEPVETVAERMGKASPDGIRFGSLGGGSDHIAFVCRAGVPSVSIGAGGSPGTSYHSNYDTVAWYRATVGEDYASPAMVTRIALALAGLVAQSDRPTWRVAPVGEACVRHLDGVIASTQDMAVRAQLERLRPGFQAIAARGARLDATLDGSIPTAKAMEAQAGLHAFLQAFVDPAGLDDRPWFRSLIAASDRDDGYAPCMLPLLAEAVRDRDAARLSAAVTRMEAAQQRALRAIDGLQAALGQPAANP
jgi:N-acetylated-alpha-linked acidic dipeptidase